MGKRKRIDTDAGRMDALDQALGDETRTQNRDVRRESTGSIIQVAGSSKEAFRAEWMNASEERKAEMVRPGDSNEAAMEGKKRKKHRKKKPQHDSTAEKTASRPDAVRANGTTEEIRASTVPIDDEEDSLFPSGLSKHQRRRWRRKLIREGVVPKDQRAGSMVTTEQRSRSFEKEEATAWIDKPIGRAALARRLAATAASNDGNAESPRVRNSHVGTEKPAREKTLARRLATTTLMPPPSKRWRGRSSQPGAVPGSSRSSNPWQRSAFGSEDVILRDSSVVTDTDPNAEIDEPTADTIIPPIRRASLENSRRPQSTSSTSLRDGLRIALPSGNTPRVAAKRASFGIKANSVPTYSIRGDAAERFKRFSAAAHGKDVGESSDDSSETSSSESTEEDIPTTNHAAGEGVNAASSHDFPPQLDGAAGSQDYFVQPQNASLASAAFSDFMRNSHTSWRTQRSRHRNMFGSELGARRSSSRIANDRAQEENQEAADELPFANLDDESFDANQAIDEVFNAEMKLTRELPAGKRRRITDLELEDGILTLESSDCRVTRSASKMKPAVAMKRVDSAIPDPASNTVIVQSMRLPEGGGFEAASDGLRALADSHALGEDHAPAVDDAAGAQTHAGAEDDREGRGESSDLNRDQAALVDESLDAGPRAGSQEDQIAGQADQEGDTIAVATAEQTPEPKKKRKMTGRTSKHFSTPKSSRNKATVKIGKDISPVPPKTPEEQPSKKRKKSSPLKETLAETKALLDGDRTGEEQCPERPKKRPRHSGGTLANLSADNITGSHSRSPSEAPQIDHEPGQALHVSEDLGPAERNKSADGAAIDGSASAQEASGDVSRTNPKKRSRRSSGTLANLDTSNIIERRSRHSGGDSNTASHNSEVIMPEAVHNHGVDDMPATREKRDDHEQNPKPKKRARRSSGTIANLDASNVLASRSRRSKDPKQAGATDPKTPDTTDSQAAEQPPSDFPGRPRPKRKSTGKRSAYFIPPKPPLDPVIDRVDHYNTTGKKKRVPAGTSTAPVPPISHPRFGIIQEKLWREPFWLLIAVTFLNKTAGRAAAPIFWKLKEQYQTPEKLAEADQGELCQIVWRLGLQRQRSTRLIKMAKAWVEGGEPVKGVRWRVLNYPVKGDGKAYKNGEPVEEDAEDVEGAIEIGKIPGCGPYAWDSWRIFCRDVLRGVADDYNGENARAENFVPEWQKVLPLDKELRACLRWMWLREGWIWDPETGEKRRATEEEMERAVKGEMEVEDEKEREFAARAAGAEAAAPEGMGQPDVAEETPVPNAEDSELSSPPASAEMGVRRSERNAGRGEKRAGTSEQDDGASSDDNIVVTPPAKKRRISGRTAALPA